MLDPDERIVYVLNTRALECAPVGDSGQINGLAPMRAPFTPLRHDEDGSWIEFPTREAAIEAAPAHDMDERHVDVVRIKTIYVNK